MFTASRADSPSKPNLPACCEGTDTQLALSKGSDRLGRRDNLWVNNDFEKCSFFRGDGAFESLAKLICLRDPFGERTVGSGKPYEVRKRALLP
jgi:hypothetical protein